MFVLGWSEGCVGCLFFVDYIDGVNWYLVYYDVSLVVVLCVFLEEFQVFCWCMGWCFDWYFLYGSDFNCDFGVFFDKV